MLWAGGALVLIVLIVVALAWKPSKSVASHGSGQPIFSQIVSQSKTSSRDEILNEDVDFIVQALKDADTEVRKAAAMERVKALASSAKASK